MRKSRFRELTQAVTRPVNGVLQTLTTTYHYDNANRLIQTDYPDGSHTQVKYNSIGKQSDTIDGLGHDTNYQYDADGRLTTTTYNFGTPAATTEVSTYDAEGRRTIFQDRAGRLTHYTYDGLGRLTVTQYPDLKTTQTVYDAIGEVTETLDARGNPTTYTYDDAGRRTSVKDAIGNLTSFAYDAAGNQLSVTQPAPSGVAATTVTTTYQYDALNRRTAVIFPDQTTQQTRYDVLGRVVAKIDQAGKETDYGYDALGRLTSVTQDPPTPQNPGGLQFVQLTHPSTTLLRNLCNLQPPASHFPCGITCSTSRTRYRFRLDSRA